MNSLSKFVITEREQYETKDNNLFAFSLAQAIRYYEFIIMIFDRYKEISQKMVSHQTMMTANFTTNNSEVMTEEQIQLFEKGTSLMRKVELEIESFYIFAKVFLDMIARFILNYFGDARSIKLNSHDKLTKNHKKYQTSKNLIFPDGFSESLTLLKEHVCDYRDKQIAHLQNPRSIKGIAYNTKGQTRISASYLYPKLTDSQVVSREPSEVMSEIDLYIQQVIAVIELNRSKTRYTIKE